MLGLFGILKEKLDSEKKLPLKFKGYIGQLYTTHGAIFNDDVLASSVAPYKWDSEQFDFKSKSWSLCCKAVLPTISTNWDNNVTIVLCTRNSDNRYATSWCGPKIATKYLYNVYQDWQSDSNNGSNTVFTETQARKGIWLKLEHVSGSMLTSYYSLDGSTWKSLGTKTYNGIDKEAVELNIEFFGGADFASVLVKDIKFIYDGKLVFGYVG